MKTYCCQSSVKIKKAPRINEMLLGNLLKKKFIPLLQQHHRFL